MLHGVDADQRARPSKACLAVDGHRAWFVLGDSQEFIDNVIRRGASVDEKKIRMRNSVLSKPFLVVLGFV